MTKSAKTAKTTKTNPKAADAASGTRTVGQVPLSLCTLSHLNPRQDVTDAEISGLASSIRTVGLLQNLAGIERGSGEVEIVAGGRRLRALNLIAEQDKTNKAATLVPVILAADEAEAQLWASTENTARADLHPADEVVAYRDMADTGMEVAEIAKAFAVRERHVKGRLRLAGLAQPILAALKADEITLDVAAAYTVSADPAQQVAAFEQLKDSWAGDNAEHIRRRLMQGAVDPSDKLAKCVGRAAYEAAGGAVREDLFGEDVYFLDADLLTELATAKLEQEGKTHEIAGWKWVETGFERPSYETTSAMGRTYPASVEATEAEAARYDELAELVEDDDASDGEVQEFEALSAKLDRQEFTETQMSHAGVILWIGYDGLIAAEYGLVRNEDRAEAETAGVCKRSHHATAGATLEKRGPYSGALVKDLAEVRTGAVQTALLDCPALALDLITFALAVPVYTDAMPLGITTEDAPNAPKTDEGMKLPKALKDGDSTPVPLDGAAAADAFKAFQRKKPQTKARILTENVARILRIGLADETANPFAEMIAAQAGLNLRRVWTPTESFLKRLKGAQLDEIMAHISGEGVPQSFAKMKKGEKVARLDKIFAGEKGIPPLTAVQRARADAWVPEGMGGLTPKATDAADNGSEAA